MTFGSIKKECFSVADIKPFPCIRPRVDLAYQTAALPYDVFSLEEAREEIEKHPLSFLRIDMSEATFPYDIDHEDEKVFERAKSILEHDIDSGTYISDETPSFYLYRLSTKTGISQTGIVACVSIDDYLEDRVKRHEKTRASKEVNRIKHVEALEAQTGPIFLTFRPDDSIDSFTEKAKLVPPLYDFMAPDKVRHTVWRLNKEEDIDMLRRTFSEIPNLYIADGHHRAASAVKSGLRRREALGTLPRTQESDYFLAVLFPSDQLTILDYNRVVKGLNGFEASTFLDALRTDFIVDGPYETAYKPDSKAKFGMFLEGHWYCLQSKETPEANDPISGLDVSLLQDKILEPLLGIEDPRNDERIDFVGGIRGMEELERRASTDMTLAFSLYPTSIEELFAVADADLLMPPKSTWFEPKLRSGLFSHQI